MYSYINKRTDKLIYVKKYMKIDENTHLRINNYTNCQQL